MLALYLGWKLYSRDWRMYVPLHEMDLKTGVKMYDIVEHGELPEKTWSNLPMRIVRGLF